MPFDGVLHAFPHAPQLFTSVRVSMHEEPHSASPLGQLDPHAPETHVASPPVGRGHTFPHEPQLFASVAASTHDEPQRVCVGEQPLLQL
jgi:hypothetical protein